MVGVTECIGEKVVQSIELFFGVRIQENYAVTGAGNRNQTRARSKPGGRTEKLKHNTRPSASNILYRYYEEQYYSTYEYRYKTVLYGT